MAWVLTWVWFLFCFQSYFEEITEGQTTFDVKAAQPIKSCCFNPSENPVGNFSVPQFLTCDIIVNTISFLHTFVNLVYLHKIKKPRKKSPVQKYTTVSLAAEQIPFKYWKVWKLFGLFFFHVSYGSGWASSQSLQSWFAVFRRLEIPCTLLDLYRARFRFTDNHCIVLDICFSSSIVIQNPGILSLLFSPEVV